MTGISQRAIDIFESESAVELLGGLHIRHGLNIGTTISTCPGPIECRLEQGGSHSLSASLGRQIHLLHFTDIGIGFRKVTDTPSPFDLALAFYDPVTGTGPEVGLVHAIEFGIRIGRSHFWHAHFDEYLADNACQILVIAHGNGPQFKCIHVRIQYFYRVKIHEKYMARAVQLGRMATVSAAPNPGVGCCIVHEGGRVIGEGFSSPAGGPHAEIQALGRVADRTLLAHSRLYVTLEPCSHYGRTPPCADAIALTDIQEIVVGITDPNPQVAGMGIARLKEAGKKVLLGILEADCRFLHRRFLKSHESGRPYVTMKWARSRDGFIAPLPWKRENPSGPHWISNIYSRQLAHRLRTENEAILVGSGTAMTDNPGLDARQWHGPDPLRLLVDRHGKSPASLRMFNDGKKTIVFGGVNPELRGKSGVERIALSEGEPTAAQILRHLKELGIGSLLVEGGSAIWEDFLEAGLWDEIWEFQGPSDLGEGIPGPKIKQAPTRTIKVDTDYLNLYYRDQEHRI